MKAFISWAIRVYLYDYRTFFIGQRYTRKPDGECNKAGRLVHYTQIVPDAIHTETSNEHTNQEVFNPFEDTTLL